jgi:hypothetical protein
MKYTIRSGYLVFQEGVIDPMNYADAFALARWLQGRGISELEAWGIVGKVDQLGEATVHLYLPKTSKG